MLLKKEELASLKLSSMDETHNEEFELIHKLHAVTKNSSQKVISEVLDELITHTIKHFVNEEKLMKEADYPDYFLHQHEHAKQLLDLKSIRSFYEMTHDKKSLSDYLEGTLSPWIVNHIEDFDMVTAEFLNQ